MTLRKFTDSSPVFLGLECGGTHSVAILADANDRCLRRIEKTGAANLRLMSDVQLVELFQSIASQMNKPAAVGIGMAGVLGETERCRVRTVASQIWPEARCWAGNDLETGLVAAIGKRGQPDRALVIIISGAGAACFGRGANHTEALTGGWGHLLGDRGSAYDIALSALRAVFVKFDETGRWSGLGLSLLRALHLDLPNQLITWVQSATKADIAALADKVFAAAADGDKLARRLLDEAAAALARNAAVCARRLTRQGKLVEFALTGTVLLKQPAFASQVKRRLRVLWPQALVKPLQREGAWGAVVLAREEWERFGQSMPAGANRESRTAQAKVRRNSSTSAPIAPSGDRPPTASADAPRKRLPDGVWQYFNSLSDVSALKNLLTEIEQSQQSGMGADERLWLDRACALLSEETSAHIDYPALAAKLGVSYEVFRHRFPKLTGTTPHRYRQSRVIAHACRLLCGTRRTVAEISDELGFCDEFHFSRSFKKLTGQSPKKFRQNFLAQH